MHPARLPRYAAGLPPAHAGMGPLHRDRPAAGQGGVRVCLLHRCAVQLRKVHICVWSGNRDKCNALEQCPAKLAGFPALATRRRSELQWWQVTACGKCMPSKHPSPVVFAVWNWWMLTLFFALASAASIRGWWRRRAARRGRPTDTEQQHAADWLDRAAIATFTIEAPVRSCHDLCFLHTKLMFAGWYGAGRHAKRGEAGQLRRRPPLKLAVLCTCAHAVPYLQSLAPAALRAMPTAC